MKIKSNSVKINIEHFNKFEQNKVTVLLLHGFTGSLEDWRECLHNFDTRFNYIGMDLIGHGKSDSTVDVLKYSADSIVKNIDDVLNYLLLDTVIILGYSMGGRVALSYAVNRSKKIKGLILESTTPGIKNEKERKERIISDEEIARFIESKSLEEFAELWLDQELFNTQRRFANEKLKKIKKMKASNSKTGLANSLRGFGTGKMPYLGDNLNNINCPVFLISGELDSKFTAINSKLKRKFSNAEHLIIKNAGHNTNLEEMKKFIGVINNFLSKF